MALGGHQSIQGSMNALGVVNLQETTVILHPRLQHPFCGHCMHANYPIALEVVVRKVNKILNDPTGVFVLLMRHPLLK